MTVETPPAGNPGLAAHGSACDAGCAPVESVAVAVEGPGPEAVNRADLADTALRGLAAELRSRGVEAREDGVYGLVDAGPRTRPQRALLRPHRGSLWWWMRWPLQDGLPSALPVIPLSPITRTSDAARRIVCALAASVGDV